MLVRVKEEFGMTPGLQLRLMDTKSHNFKDGKLEKIFFLKNKTGVFRFRDIFFRHIEF